MSVDFGVWLSQPIDDSLTVSISDTEYAYEERMHGGWCHIVDSKSSNVRSDE